jgi:hypothetical protein
MTSVVPRTCARCGGLLTTGSPRDLGGCINQTISCEACGIDCYELSTRKEEPVAKKATKTPRDRDLPGMEDRAIAVLETLAAEYAELRDERIQLNAQEVVLKQKLLGEMHRLKRSSYRRPGVEIEIEPGEETIKVRVRKEAAADEEPTPDRKSAAARRRALMRMIILVPGELDLTREDYRTVSGRGLSVRL